MRNKISLNQTLNFVVSSHGSQTDHGGNPYWFHCYRVMKRLGVCSIEEKHAALLHDIIEDTPITVNDLKQMGYSSRVIEIVLELTRPATGSYLDWIRKIKLSGNISAIKIKFADNADNSCPSRINSLPMNKRSLLKRYKKSMGILSEGAEKELQNIRTGDFRIDFNKVIKSLVPSETEYCYTIIDVEELPTGLPRLVTKTCPFWNSSECLAYSPQSELDEWLIADQVKICNINQTDS